MNARIREILKRMENHCLSKQVATPVRTTHGALDDQDTFDNGELTLMEVLNLKRVLTRLNERVTHEHYNTLYRANNEHVKEGGYLIREQERQLVETELSKPRTFPMPPLPDRELTLKEKGRVLNTVENALREFGLVDHPSTTQVAIRVPVGNGETEETIGVPDTEIGRRLLALHKELVSLRNAVLPRIAHDKTPLNTYWTLGNQWKKEHIRTCHACGSVCDVYTHNWEDVREKTQ